MRRRKTTEPRTALKPSSLCVRWLRLAGLSRMRRPCSCVIALAVMLVGLSTAHAADTTLTLACQGTVTQNDAKPEPLSMGVIVDFAARTVHGFGYPVEITAMDDVIVTFARSTQPTIDGTIDRVTGDLQATFVMLSMKNNKVLLTNHYLLKCRPSQRMF